MKLHIIPPIKDDFKILLLSHTVPFDGEQHQYNGMNHVDNEPSESMRKCQKRVNQEIKHQKSIHKYSLQLGLLGHEWKAIQAEYYHVYNPHEVDPTSWIQNINKHLLGQTVQR